MPSLEKCLFNSSIHFLIGLFGFLISSWVSCLYILEIYLLSVSSFASIFSQSEGCLFDSCMVSFAVLVNDFFILNFPSSNCLVVLLSWLDSDALTSGFVYKSHSRCCLITHSLPMCSGEASCHDLVRNGQGQRSAVLRLLARSHVRELGRGSSQAHQAFRQGCSPGWCHDCNHLRNPDPEPPG